MDDYLPIVVQYWFPEQAHSSNLNSNAHQNASPLFEQVDPKSKQQKRRQDTTLTWEDVHEKFNSLDDFRDKKGVFSGDYEKEISKLPLMAQKLIEPILKQLRDLANLLCEKYQCFFELGKCLQEKTFETANEPKPKQSAKALFHQAVSDLDSLRETLKKCSSTAEELLRIFDDLPDKFSTPKNFADFKHLVDKRLSTAHLERSVAKIPKVHRYEKDLPKTKNPEWARYVKGVAPVIYDCHIDLTSPLSRQILAYLLKNTHRAVTYKMILVFLGHEATAPSKRNSVSKEIGKIEKAIKNAFALNDAKPLGVVGGGKKAKKDTKVEGDASRKERRIRIEIEMLEDIVRQRQEAEITEKLSRESVFKFSSSVAVKKC
ncbi:MAG: hypothetical protein J0M26_18000 [Planctomycetes bacterium]|nr:hypothetical protein [Planctomycetota bacterium]